MQNPKNPGVALSYTGSNPNDGTWNDQQPEVVRCPICGDTYVHLSAPQRISGEDAYKSWAGRGDLVVIPMWCEAGHAWDLCFGEHKGNTVAFIRNAREDLSDTGEQQ